MAKQRINPEFSPDRVVQPTSSPVDVYFRPMLRAPDVAKQLELAKALQDLAPQLERFTSDAVAFASQAERAAGEIDALNAPDQATLRRKATEAIEKAGGIAPWRYQAFLEATGARLVRDGYQSKLYESLEDLSEPTNADGTARDPDYVTQRMSEFYKEVGIPEDSFFIQKGAANAKMAADRTFMDRITLMRAEKVKLKAENDLRDSITFALQTTPLENLDELFTGPGGRITAAMNAHYANGFGSGNDVLMTSMQAWAESLAAEHDYDGARKVVGFLMKNPVGGRKIGDRFTPLLKKKMEEIDDEERKYQANEIQLKEMRQRAILNDATDQFYRMYQEKSQANQEAGRGGYVSLTMGQREEAADKILAGMKGFSEQEKQEIKGRVMEGMRVFEEAQNNTNASDPMVYADLTNKASSMAPEEFKPLLLGQLAQGNISKADFATLTGLNNNPSAFTDSETSFDAIWEGKFEQEANQFALSFIESNKGTIPEEQTRRMLRTIVTEYRARLHEAFMGEQGPITTRRGALLKRITDIEDRLELDMKSRTDALKTVSPEKRNLIGAPPATSQPVPPVEIAPDAPGSIGSAVRPASGFFDIFAKNAPAESNEAKTRTSADQIVSLLPEIQKNPTPENQAKWDKAKGSLNANAEAGIKEIAESNLRDDPKFRYSAGTNGIPSDAKKFEYREDGVYTWDYVKDPKTGIRGGYSWKKRIDDATTNRYWVYKTIQGYSPEEIANGRTDEGLKITDKLMDPRTFLMFRSVSEFDAAVKEYIDNGGRTGFIAETLLPKLRPFGTDFAGLMEAQRALLQVRKPLN